MSFPAYPDYKHSGIELLPEYPSHWALKRFKNVFEERAERSSDGSEELLSVSAYFGVKPRSETLDEGDHLSRAESLEGYKVCRAGDLVINIMLAWNRGLGFSWQHGIVSPAYSVFHVTDGSYPKFLDYLVRSDEYIRYFKTHSAGIMDSRLRLYPESFGRLFSAIPSACEQTQIARFLDHETARIDALIEEQQRLIELLKEKRQAVISHAVTKGLDPTAPMKDSGVEWLGEVPAHWRVGNVKYFLEAIGDVDHYMPQSVDKGIPYVMTGDLMELVSDIQFEECKQVAYEDYLKLSGRIKTSKGDVVMARYATIGSVSYVDIDAEFLVSYSCVTIKPDLSKVLGIYLFYYFKSCSFLNGIRAKTNTNTQDNVGVGDIKDLKIALPPAAEQMKIVDYLQSELGRLDAISEVSLSTISLAREKRSALISAAVTGKIDVRGWQPPVSTQAPKLEVAEAN
ncbi:restriction modification system DNA specificity domain-containing protein [Stutzerimonas degradans]|nr:restriction modification system DNA specificity domain-containing protein [Stutzerimonas degradans]